jgi:hypothetical protein
MWYLRTDIGTFYILPYEKRYRLIVNDQFLAVFESPVQAAQAVKKKATGYGAWDAANEVTVPELDAWLQPHPAPWM